MEAQANTSREQSNKIAWRLATLAWLKWRSRKKIIKKVDLKDCAKW